MRRDNLEEEMKRPKVSKAIAKAERLAVLNFRKAFELWNLIEDALEGKILVCSSQGEIWWSEMDKRVELSLKNFEVLGGIEGKETAINRFYLEKYELEQSLMFWLYEDGKRFEKNNSACYRRKTIRLINHFKRIENIPELPVAA
jgi:hypothetical protein